MTRANLGEEDIMEPERRVTRGMSRDGDRMEENERRALEELRRAMGQDLGVEDSGGGTVNWGEEGTQGVVLALMQMVANMNKDMMEERRRREEWEQRRERETGKGATFGAGWCPGDYDVNGGKECAAKHRRGSPKMAQAEFRSEGDKEKRGEVYGVW
ncbi:hypothetical protein TREMEDRAFT_61455 [Tremella mesenterica DSM 1558]|uniref:uncharacterized protein n=1 Tax=Tremella mesenterica (strain ATCC 24925 / CBS 8224 / DSM 1558 / NBRC 9311 / NRRL Y-6157 / RJB 2259-6 / UBC 559-6) TaxID=578456 RepID=UPI0003F4A1A3|nr:uncharacterized protein TREMEDRAFT_61455 [Tremella mesenterica DSM 1558]EIW70940.1 hypothetical protein TREMEDRAFT_61455 [Tremella mesenterica DSM 1558]